MNTKDFDEYELAVICQAEIDQADREFMESARETIEMLSREVAELASQLAAARNEISRYETLFQMSQHHAHAGGLR